MPNESPLSWQKQGAFVSARSRGITLSLYHTREDHPEEMIPPLRPHAALIPYAQATHYQSVDEALSLAPQSQTLASPLSCTPAAPKTIAIP
jgi:hypothetical protein